MLIGQVPFHADSQVGVAMKHVNEELPDVQQRRPEVSAAVALVVERATAKDPAERYQEVGEMIDDLSTALEVEAARAGSTTGEATSVLDAVPPPKRKLSGRGRWSWAAIALLVLVGGGALLAVQLISSGRSPGGGGGALKDKGSTVAISSATDYDPQGDGEEDPSTVGLAVDGNPTGTAWSSEHYDTDTFAGTKTGPDPGVGLYVTTKPPATPSKMVDPHADPRLGRGDLRHRLRPAGRTLRMGRTGRRGDEAADRRPPKSDSTTLANAAKYFLIWFNKAAPARDQEGRFQVEISDVKLLRLRPGGPQNSKERARAGGARPRAGRGGRRGPRRRCRSPRTASRRRWSR